MMRQMIFLASSLLTVATACSNHTPISPNQSCRSPGNQYQYTGEDGSIYHVIEGDGFVEIYGPGLMSSDSLGMNLFINDKFEGIVINNYVAIDNVLIKDGRFYGGNLACVFGRADELPNAGQVYICENEQGERIAYKGNSEKGIYEFFALGNGKSYLFRLVGNRGIGRNCDW